MRWYPLLFLMVLLAVPAGAQIMPAGLGLNVTMDHIPLWFVFGYSFRENITSYNFTASADLTGNNSWMILGSNNGHTLTLLDEHINTSLSGGVNASFTMATTGFYRYYYVYLFDGFSTTGDYLEVHLYAGKEETTTIVYIAGESE
jgi:hypothetical protein